MFDYAKGAERYNAWVAELMNAYGYRTKSAMFKGMKHPRIEVQHDQMTIMPTKRERGEGSGPTLRREKDYVYLVADISPQEMGSAVRVGLERCVG